MTEPQPSTYKRVEIYSLVKDEDGTISRVPKCLCELCRINHFLCPRYGGNNSAQKSNAAVSAEQVRKPKRSVFKAMVDIRNNTPVTICPECGREIDIIVGYTCNETGYYYCSEDCLLQDLSERKAAGEVF